MVDVCNMANFPKEEFFSQHKIPQASTTPYDYQVTRLLLVRIEPVFDPANPTRLIGLKPVLEDAFSYVQSDGTSEPGVPKASKPWDQVVLEALGGGSEFLRTAFDFGLWRESRVVVLLEDQFWQFSPSMSAFTTKHLYDEQYFDLRRHCLIGGKLVNATEAQWFRDLPTTACQCISFFTKKPCYDGFQVVHGFSFNVDLVFGGDRLPLTIDPDIENKGGPPGP